MLKKSSLGKNKARKIFVCVFLVFIVCIGFVFKLRWHAWFGNVPEEPYITPDSVDRVMLTSGQDFAHSRVISWRCDTVLRPSGVILQRIEDSVVVSDRKIESIHSTIVSSNGGKGAYYNVVLDGLDSGLYRYRAYSGKDTSQYYSFAVHPINDSLRMLFIGDVQDPTGALSDSLFDHLQRCGPNVDFVAMCGDQIEASADKYWNIWYKSLSSWGGSMPMIVSTGNHEYLKKFFYSELDPRWVWQFYYPQNGPKGFISRSYYIDFPLCRLVVMDTNSIEGIPSINNHRAWLKEVMASSDKKWNILMMHHAVDCARSGRTNLVMHYMFKSLILSLKFDLVLQGHDHSYARWNSYDDGVATTPIRVISVASPKMYSNKFDLDIDRMASGLPLYQYIRMNNDSLEYSAYTFDDKIYDDLVIRKSKNDVSIDDKAKHWRERFEYDAFPRNAKGDKERLEYKKAVFNRNMSKK